MEHIYVIIVGVLFLLAISDLIVGVSNDAVNFLNSAIGSKAAPLRVILIVAALGVLAGATFSNGMMEVARKSIFLPEAFTFREIMIIFLAVMLTDVILLDLFNTFGLPTSTTVSIVFELLGAAVGIAIIKVSGDPNHTSVIEYINSGKALFIIFGILLSVVVAFSVGAIVQWITRLIFSFNFENNIKYFGGLFGGLAITAITYFILIKGLKGSVYATQVFEELSLKDWTDFFAGQNYDGFKGLAKSLTKVDVIPELAAWGKQLMTYDKESYKSGIEHFQTWIKFSGTEAVVPLQLMYWVKYHTLKILFVSFAAFSVVLQLLYALFRINIFKTIVIIGTFALAMAFAGNDLVNFIGVPLAGFASFQEFRAQQLINPGNDGFLMEALSGKVDTQPILLLIAGMVMVITLWLSKKAKSVVKTSLNLSDQDAVNERFESSALARGLVRVSVHVGNGLGVIVPRKVKTGVSSRFNSEHFKNTNDKAEGVSFDMVRASVNLVVASILIAIGTSLKLPLSTTYVTFMVAMGTSLADGAWDRESAVYRITGVVTVIGGWFFTAFSAFTAALIIAILLNATWWGGVFVMIAIALFVVYRTQIVHKKRSAEEEKNENGLLGTGNVDNIHENCALNITSILLSSSEAIDITIKGLQKEKRKKLKEGFKIVKKLNAESKSIKKKVPEVIRELNDDAFEIGHYYVEVIEHMREAMHCLNYIASPCLTHVENNHKPITDSQSEVLDGLNDVLKAYLEKVTQSVSELNFTKSEQIIEESLSISEDILKLRKKQLKLIKKEPGSTRANLLFLDVLNELKNFVLNVNNLYKSFRDFSEHNDSISIKSLQ